MQVVPLKMLVPYEKKEIGLHLKNSMDPKDPHNMKLRGRLTLEMTFVPFLEDSKKFSRSSFSLGNGSSRNDHDSSSLVGTGLLLVNVIEAKDVEGKSNPSNPYAAVLFRGDRRRTKVIMSSFDHFLFEFLISIERISPYFGLTFECACIVVRLSIKPGTLIGTRNSSSFWTRLL